jgi:hypothetical protein
LTTYLRLSNNQCRFSKKSSEKAQYFQQTVVFESLEETGCEGKQGRNKNNLAHFENNHILPSMVSFQTVACQVMLCFSCTLVQSYNKQEEQKYWKMKKLEELMHKGKHVRSWDLEPPRDHPMWFNRSEIHETYRWGMEGMHDLGTMEVIPRPLMPNWWCPTPCGTLNLSRKILVSSS